MGRSLYCLMLLIPAFTLIAQSAPVTVEDDFSPGLLFFVLFAFFVIGTMLVVGTLFTVLVVGVLGALVLAGIISTSALIGLKTRRVTKGIRALFLQLGAVAGAPAGILITLVIAHFGKYDVATSSAVLIGLITGMLSGVLVAILFNTAWSLLVRRLVS